ncbi:DUF4817 domain-containing protein [Trichonephila clavipes]|nr:DUF4817 domain-containing protein [Trichonephila clavipes]
MTPLEVLLNKMSSMQEKAYCVFEYAKTSSVTVEQRHFRTKFRKEPPHRHNISSKIVLAPPHWNKNVREFLNEHLLHRWIGRAGPKDFICLHWSPRSPDLTPCDFFLWGFVKDKVFVRPVPQDLEELKQRMTAVLNSIT